MPGKAAKVRCTEKHSVVARRVLVVTIAKNGIRELSVVVVRLHDNRRTPFRRLAGGLRKVENDDVASCNAHELVSELP